jgi:hypothetical protein
MIDLPLSAVLGLDAGPIEDNVISMERVDAVQRWLAGAIRDVPDLRYLDVAPGMVRELARALSTPVSEMGINLWNKRAEIRKYADISAYPATEAHELELYEHELKQTIKPTIEVRVNGVTITSVTLAATASITVKAARLVIRGGWITHVRLGDIMGKAVLGIAEPLALAKLELHEVKSAPWKLDQELKLPGNGIRIPSA